MSFERYAIYWAPHPDSALGKFGRLWLGGDAETGALHGQRDAFGLDADLLERATRSPRRYGLHATIKAPFRLAEMEDEAALSKALAAFCARRRRACSGPLRLHRFTRFLALVPGSERTDIEWLADECVTHFDRFRAPLSEADRTRRAGSLSPLAQQQFEQFGYPYIFSRFFFHVTLAGPLEEEDLGRVEAALAPAVVPFTQDAFQMEDLCLFGDPGGGGLFKIVRRYPFRR